MNTEAICDEAEMLAAEIGKLLAGKSLAIVTLALADCLARCLTGHIVIGDPAETARLREQIIQGNFELVRQLVAREIAEESPK